MANGSVTICQTESADCSLPQPLALLNASQWLTSDIMSGCVFFGYFRGEIEFMIHRETAEQKPQLSADETIEHAKRAFALKKYEQAVDYYATALELKYAPQLGFLSTICL